MIFPPTIHLLGMCLLVRIPQPTVSSNDPWTPAQLTPIVFPPGFGAFFQEKQHGWPARWLKEVKFVYDKHSTSNADYTIYYGDVPPVTRCLRLWWMREQTTNSFLAGMVLDSQTQWVRCNNRYIYIYGPYSRRTHIIGSLTHRTCFSKFTDANSCGLMLQHLKHQVYIKQSGLGSHWTSAVCSFDTCRFRRWGMTNLEESQ